MNLLCNDRLSTRLRGGSIDVDRWPNGGGAGLGVASERSPIAVEGLLSSVGDDLEIRKASGHMCRRDGVRADQMPPVDWVMTGGVSLMLLRRPRSVRSSAFERSSLCEDIAESALLCEPSDDS